jgi:hypothetical protein
VGLRFHSRRQRWIWDILVDYQYMSGEQGSRKGGYTRDGETALIQCTNDFLFCLPFLDVQFRDPVSMER